MDMNCWHCNIELIWGGDHDCEDSVEWLIVSNLHCPRCQSHVDVYFPREEDDILEFPSDKKEIEDERDWIDE